MGIIFFAFYFIIIMIIIINIFKTVKHFGANNEFFNNVQELVQERFDSVIQQNSASDKVKYSKEVEEPVNLDNFMKSNTNPIKETRGKRRKI
jgi:hypothetical protein